MSVAVNRKAIYSVPEDSPDQRLEYNLDNWKRWMKSDVLTDGAPNRAAGCIGGGYSASFDDLVDAADVRCAMAVDALIRSLVPIQQAAIHHRYLAAVYRFPRGNYEASLQAAKAKLKAGMDAKGIY